MTLPQPGDDSVSDVVEKWEAATQHLGKCCASCEQDGEYLELHNGEPACCCNALRAEVTLTWGLTSART